MFSSVNIQDELVKIRQKHAGVQHSLTQQVEDAKGKGAPVDEFILRRIRTAAKPGKWNFENQLLDKNKVFSIDDIKSICIQYRLRFLDSKFFKLEDLTADEKNTVKSLEKETGKEITKVKMLASTQFFRQENLTSAPFLFAQLDETNFYLVHKVGVDFKWYKKLISFPFRSILALLITLLVIVLPLMFVIPSVIFSKPEQVQYYQMLYLAGFTVSTLFIVVFGGFTFYKKFSNFCWKSPYLN